jgi:signal transduction histidine kinase/putative methionine-R-sulfoxide reductase with GAF domain/HAMP domain-containing protein
LTLAISGVAVVIVVVWRFGIEPSLRMGVAKEQQQLAQRIADQIDEFLDKRIGELLMAVEIGRFWENEKNRQKGALYRLLKLDPLVHEVSVADREGREVLRLSRTRVSSDADLVSLKGEEKFQQSIQGKVYIGKVYHAPTNEPFVTLAVPIKFTATDIRGVVAAEVSLKMLWDSISHIKVGKSGHAFVVDQEGKLIAHSDFSKVLLELNMAHLQEVKEFLKDPNEDPDLGEIHTGENGQRVLTNFAVVSKPHWAVIVEESVETALADVKRMERFASVIFLFLLAGAFGLSYWFSERIAQPVRKLEEGSRLITDGNLEHKLEIHTGDEIETLAHQFNQMAQALKTSHEGLEAKIAERTKEISALYSALTPLAPAGSVKEMLERVIDRLMDVTGADAALVRIWDKTTGNFIHATQRGFPDHYLKIAEAKAIGTAVGYVFESGEPIISPDIALDSRLKGKLQLQVGLRSCALLPLRVRGKMLGVIHLASRERGHFSEEKKDFLMAIAHQMRIAVENRELFEETQRSLGRIRALQEIDQAISSTLDLHTVLDVLLEKIALVLPYAATTVRLFNKASGLLEPVACRHLDEKEWKAGQWKGGRGIPNVVFESKALRMVSNVQTDPSVRDPEFFRKHGLVSYLGVPLIVKDKVLGVLSFYTKQEHEFASEEVEFLMTLAGQAAIAVHNAQLYEEARVSEAALQETNRMLSALHAVAAAASQSLDLDRVLQAAIDKITDVFGFDVTRIHIYDERAGELLLRASFETDPDRFTAARSFKKGEGIVGKVAESGKPLIFEDVPTAPLYQQLSRTKISAQFGYHFFAVFPIKGRLKNLGTLGCGGIAPRKLSSGEVQLLEALADQIAVAIENSELYENVKQKVEELQQKTAELERANKVKDEFLSVMSHELRTPLHGVIGYMGLMQDKMLGDLNQEQERALDKMSGFSKDLLTMIESIMEATKIEAGAIVVEQQTVNLTDFLNDLRSAYPIPLSKKLTLNWDLSPGLPLIETDSTKLKQILQNLINNAIKFTDEGSVTVSARCLDGGSRGANGRQPAEDGAQLKFIEFKVADTGIGIAKEVLPIIFERFRQVDSSETRRYGGVGIGLYIVKKFTKALGGKVEVESESGKGSTFTVTIPCEAPQSGVSQEAPEARRNHQSFNSTGPQTAIQPG